MSTISAPSTQHSLPSLPSTIDTGVTATATVVRAVRPGSSDMTVNHVRVKSSATNSRPATANGSVPTSAPPNRASPIPNQANIPNGKPTSPIVSQSNPMSMSNGSVGSPAPQTVTSKDPKAVAAAASDMRNIVRRKLTGYVGFANLPNQWHRKSVRKGFNFNVMVVGEYITAYSCTTAG
jgi:hypothetical protein